MFINLKQQNNLTRKSTKMGPSQKKISEKTDRVEHMLTFGEIQQIAVSQENL